MWAIGALLAGVGVLIVVVMLNKGETVPDEPALSATQSRDALTAAMQDAVAAISLPTETNVVRAAPFSCELDGAPAYTLHLEEMQGPALEDVDAAFVTIREVWEQRDLVVQPRNMGQDVRGLSGTDQYGGTVYVLTGPDGTVFSGESACRPKVG